MSGAGRTIEAIKTALIALLAVSALLLAWRTGLFNDFFVTVPFFGNVAELMRGAYGAAEEGGAVLKEAARPICIVITDDGGGRFCAKYDTDTRNAVYDRTSSILSEALGSSSEHGEISEGEWREALSGPGVYFEYAIPVKLSILDGWLDAHMQEAVEDVYLLCILVGFGADRNRVYYRDAESGLFYGADTASSAGKAQELGIYSANGAVFAFETDIAAAERSPYALLMPGSEHPVVHAGEAGSAELLPDVVLAALGYRDEMPAILPEGDGAIKCVGTQYSILVDADSRVSYRYTDFLPPAEERETLGEADMIERARVIAADTVGSACGDAEVFFESFEYSSGVYTVCFGYYIAGGRIHLYDDVFAARVSFLSGTVTAVELVFRSFAPTGETSSLLPERQAFAASNGSFVLSYSDTGAGLMQPFWH